MSSLAETILLVFGLVAVGYLAGWTGYLKTETGDALSEFAVGVAVPLLLFRTMTGADFHGAAPWSFWATYFSAVAVAWATGHLVTTRVFGRDELEGITGGVSTAFSNLVLLGVPFMQSVYGQAGFEVLSLLIAVHLPIMILVSMLLFAFFGRRAAGDVKASDIVVSFVRKLSTNPLIVGILAGLVWRLTGLSLPPLAVRFVDALANIAGPIALFAMGLGLRKFGISGTVLPAFVLSLLKLFLMPAVALAAAWLLGLPPLSAKVAVAAAALPSGVNSYLIAAQFGTGQALASSQMTIATALAVFTTAFWISVSALVFG